MINKPWILYARVSKRDQHTENQEFRLKEYAVSKGYTYDYFSEEESTRKTRPVKANVLTLLRSGKYEGVIVVKLDRWARSTQELILEVTELYKKGIQFVSLRENIDLSTATGKLQFTIISAFAEFERELIRDRTLEGLERAKRSGKYLGRPKGSKDKKVRRRSGYIMREAKKRQLKDSVTGDHKDITHYIDNPPPNNTV